MTSPNSTFTDMVSTTLRAHRRTLADNVSEHNGLLTRLKQKGNIKMDGGYEIVEPLDYAENGTFQRYSGYDPLNVNPSDVISAAKYDWAQAAIHVTASGRELRMNNGKQRMINLVKARIKNAFRTAANNISIDLFGSGALSNQLGGLGLVIQDDGNGTVGGINSSNYAFWNNQFEEMSGTDTWSSSTILGEFNDLWLKTTRGKDKTDLIVASHDVFSAYEASQQQYQRYADPDMAKAGFESYKYKSADVIFDDNSNFSTTAESAYFLNTDYLFFVEHSDAAWTQGEERQPVNQDAVVIPLYEMCQLVCSNRALQGKLIDAA